MTKTAALVAVQAFLDDICAVVKPERVAEVHASQPPDCQRIYAAAMPGPSTPHFWWGGEMQLFQQRTRA